LKPYYQDKWVKIYHGDCREILPQLDVKVDLVLTDPPYGIGLELDWLNNVNNKRIGCKSIDRITNDDGSLDLAWLFTYPRWLVFGFPYISNANATGWLVWDKQPGLEIDRTIMTPVEMASTNIWNGFRLVRAMWAGYMRDNGECRFPHPTQKPMKVIDYCINANEQYVRLQGISRYLTGEFVKAGIRNIEIARLFPSRTGGLTGCVSNWLLGFNVPTREEYARITEYVAGRCSLCQYDELTSHSINDGLILDPFLGSGTTCYCAKKLNRYSIGIEIEEKYCEIAAKRCCQEVMELV